MLAFNLRWVNTVINKLRLPGDGDIFVPVGTVSVIGTTSVKTDDPGDTRVERWEVERVLDECEAMTPGISRARILRAWGGVRPLYDPGLSSDGRDAKRTFTVLDHAESDGIAGLVSIIGGKLTTYRLMAERVADIVCAQVGRYDAVRRRRRRSCLRRMRTRSARTGWAAGWPRWSMATHPARRSANVNS